MKYILWLIFYLFFYKGFGQSYKIIFYNQCTKTYSNLPECFYSLRDKRDCTFRVNHYNEDFFVKLPKTGKYKVYLSCMNVWEEDTPIEVDINHTLRIDTISLQSLDIVNYISNPPTSEYLCCEAVCEGKFTDYYHNGKIRKTGIFKKGQAIDTLKEYYLNGRLKSLFIPLQRWWKKYNYVTKRPDYIWMDYHEKGYLIKLWNTRKKQEIVYHPNQKIKINYQYKKKPKYSEYDTNGIKRAIILFNQKGEYSWKEGIEIKKGFFVDGKIQYIYKKQDIGGKHQFSYQEYDQNNNLIRMTEFSGDYWSFGYCNYPESIDNVSSEYMKEDIVYISQNEKVRKKYTIDFLEGGKRILKKIETDRMNLVDGTWIIISNTEYYNQKP
jgi:hypothetical protein